MLLFVISVLLALVAEMKATSNNWFMNAGMITLSTIWVQNIVTSDSASSCLIVCLSACLLISKTTHPNIIKFSVHVIVTMAWSYFDSSAIRCDSSFVDDVMFSSNRLNWPESKMMLTFCPVRQVAAPGVKSAIFNCILLCLSSLCTSLCSVCMSLIVWFDVNV